MALKTKSGLLTRLQAPLGPLKHIDCALWPHPSCVLSLLSHWETFPNLLLPPGMLSASVSVFITRCLSLFFHSFVTFQVCNFPLCFVCLAPVPSLSPPFQMKVLDFPGGAIDKESTCQCKTHKRCGFDPWVWKNPLEEGMATHSSILAWRIPWTEAPGRL